MQPTRAMIQHAIESAREVIAACQSHPGINHFSHPGSVKLVTGRTTYMVPSRQSEAGAQLQSKAGKRMNLFPNGFTAHFPATSTICFFPNR